MDILTATIAEEIKKQYKSVRSFANAINIPQTTISSTLRNGVSGTAYDTIVKICKVLDIKLINYDFPIFADEASLNMLDVYNKLDDKGKHAVCAVLKSEYERCSLGYSEHSFHSTLPNIRK